MRLFIAASPHSRNPQDVSSIMLNVILALVPTSLLGVFFFGIPALSVIITSILSALAFEVGVNTLRHQKLTIFDGSAALTGLLLALTLPPVIPLWMVVLGNGFSIVIVKHLFGGLGHNLFNPALSGRLFLSVTYPVAMSSWSKPSALLDPIYISSATPFAKESTLIVSHWQLFWGGVGGSIGETSAFAILLGAIWLFKKGILDWKIPGSFLSTVFLLALLGGQDPVLHLLAGGTLLGAFFMMTDYVTSPLTKMGRLLYGFLLGVLVMSVRFFSQMPGGLAFCIVLMNGMVPLLDKAGITLHLHVYPLIFKEIQEK